ncbi:MULTISPECIES: hypothetical protein [Bizionia]|uniref:Uncharacterized protein n=1 Tax=Bizionia algoritergicola TaxID=291187 RepID=A0A5D0R164_9FLAO|nr:MULTISPECIES: hypothetical protein [Bizionia]OBX20949.1 hypothetical protein BAA08_14515 [Bizionia sp. APA-3]TYB74601.1 hypothetical protein ES675_00205 [Bizionia algoritergicola]
MASLSTIKNWFKTGLKPTQAQFWATWDSFRHKDEAIPLDSVNGLQDDLDDKVDKISGKGLSTEDYTTPEKLKLASLPDALGLGIALDSKVDKVSGKGLSTEDYTTEEKEQVSLASKNIQEEVIDIDGDFALVDADFRVTFFINTTGTVNITIPTATLRDSFVCFFIVIGAGQLNILVDGLGATLNAPDGTLLSNGKRGMVEKKITADTFYASGEWEV